MHGEDIRRLVLDTVTTILPGVDTERIRSDESLRAQVDLDSMDWLNVVTGLSARLEIPIPERDYGKLLTLDDIVAYLSDRLSARTTR